MVREVGFDDVFDSQATFRALLEALSRPGKICLLPDRVYRSPPRGFCPPALSILKTLCDHRVSFSLVSGNRTAELSRYLEVNLATPLGDVEKADYVIFDGVTFDEDFMRMKRGTPEFPENSATALVCVARLDEGAAETETASCHLRCAGPGVKDAAFLTVTGLDPRYNEARARTNNVSPLGIDLFLVDPGGRVAGIPRTTFVEAS